MGKVKVLDKGYVSLIDVMGDDTAVVNAARASFNKHVDVLSEKDKGLIRFLIRENHTSPFRHSALQFEVYAPMMVARQWWKYHVSSTHTESQDGWNEVSRRYVSDDIEFYLPEASEWRTIPDSRKQGSGPPLNISVGQPLTSRVLRHFNKCADLYDELVNDLGVAPEQARLVLPAYALYVRWRWTTSLHGLLNFLDQRLAEDAQLEITQYAAAVRTLAEPYFPYTFEAWGVVND